MAFWLRYTGACVAGVVGMYLTGVLIAMMSPPPMTTGAYVYQASMFIAGFLAGFNLTASYFFRQSPSTTAWVMQILVILVTIGANILVFLLAVRTVQVGGDGAFIALLLSMFPFLSSIASYVIGGFLLRRWAHGFAT